MTTLENLIENCREGKIRWVDLATELANNGREVWEDEIGAHVDDYSFTWNYLNKYTNINDIEEFYK